MIVKLSMPDEVYERYEVMALQKASAAKTVKASTEEQMALQLDRFSFVSPVERVLVIDSVTRSKLELILSGGSLSTPADLLKKVQALADLKIQGVSLNFTPGQLQQLRSYATKNNKTIEKVIEETVRNMEMLFFNHVG